MHPPLSRIAALDSIRFPAALLVVFFHGGVVGLGGPLGNLAGNGYVAVSFFFLLSGFVLAISYRGSAREFWLLRLTRLYPVYLVGLLLALRHLGDYENPDLGGPLAERVVLPLLMLQSWHPDNQLAWNPPAWSLSVEVAFYAAFPFLFLGLYRLSTRALVAIAGGAWALSLAAAVLYLVLSPDGLAVLEPDARGTWLNLLRWSPPPHFPTFIMGMATGMLFRRGFRLQSAGLPAALSAAGIAGVLALGTTVPYVFLHNGILSPLVAILVLALASSPPRWLEHPRITRLGGASYALYITHFSLIFVVRVGADLRAISPLAGWIGVAIGSSLLVLFALGVRYFEAWWTLSLRRRFLRSRAALDEAISSLEPECAAP